MKRLILLVAVLSLSACASAPGSLAELEQKCNPAKPGASCYYGEKPAPRTLQFNKVGGFYI